MPRLERRLVCRGYEMDARQRVSPGALARYMEHLRWEAIYAGSFGLAQLFATGHKMVVRAQDLWIGAPALHGTELALTLSLARVGNSSLVFAESATRVNDGADVARAFVTLVVLDAHGKPTRVPQAMRAELEAAQVPEVPSLEVSVPSDGYTRSVGVRPSDLDTLLHVNQSRYVDFVDDTRSLMLTARGSTGQAAHPSRIVIDYRRETHVGRDLSAHACALDDEVRAIAVDLRDAVDGELVARARIMGGL